MVGRSLTDYFHRDIRTAPATAAPPVLSVRDLKVPNAVRGVDLDVRPGEVVGLAGLVGCGRVEVVRAIFGADPATGQVSIDGEVMSRPTPRGSIARGVALVTGDRKGEGLVAGASVAHNLTMISNGRLSLLPVAAGRQRRTAVEIMKKLQVRPDDPTLPAGSLSGGNQQKVVIGRWLSSRPKVLLMDEPTRGVDVGAKSEIYRLVRELAAGGVAVVVSSSENVELLGLCDRILMMLHGHVVADLPADELDELTIAEHVAGVQQHV